MPSSLQMGANKIFRRMSTNDTCVTTSTAIDSITINKQLLRGVIIDGNSLRQIKVFPNPFISFLLVRGLTAPNRTGSPLPIATAR